MTVARLSVVEPDALVVRLRARRRAFEPGVRVATPDDFVPEKLSAQASADDFVPSKDEKADAEATGDPVLVSVWNEARTSVLEAIALYGRQAFAFRLRVEGIEDVCREQAGPRFQVLADPLPRDARPGADGHCGIIGLDRRSGEPRPVWRNFLATLAERAVPVMDQAGSDP